MIVPIVSAVIYSILCLILREFHIRQSRDIIALGAENTISFNAFNIFEGFFVPIYFAVPNTVFAIFHGVTLIVIKMNDNIQRRDIIFFLVHIHKISCVNFGVELPINISVFKSVFYISFGEFVIYQKLGNHRGIHGCIIIGITFSQSLCDFVEVSTTNFSNSFSFFKRISELNQFCADFKLGKFFFLCDLLSNLYEVCIHADKGFCATRQCLFNIVLKDILQGSCKRV